MKLSPRNRHLVVEKIVEPTPDTSVSSAILLPDDYRPVDSPHSYVRIFDIAPDCTIAVSKGDTVLVETHMLQELEIADQKTCLVLENYILGVLTRY
jgi:co-chaperonin GroES (HSP10)